MKKIVIILLGATALFVASVYILIPSVLTNDETINFSASPVATSRVLQENGYWEKWWPGTSNNSLEFNDRNFFVKEKLYNQFKIDIISGSDTVNSVLNVIPLNMDSTQLEWITAQSSSINPFTRFSQYLLNENVKKDIRKVLNAAAQFMSKQENIYGIKIHREVVEDTLMISTRAQFNDYPSVRQVDSLIQTLRNYLQQEGAHAVDSPMLHVDNFGARNFEAQVAIPTNKPLQDKGKVQFRRMIRGYMLIADVKGGEATVQEGIRQIENLMRDYMRVSPAIPFELMLTNRAAEPDTSKWITRIYYPVVL